MGYFGRLLRRIQTRLQRTAPAPGRGADSAFAAASLVRAGEIALEAGETREALTLFGRAVDAYLPAREWRKAETLCRLMIRIEPRVIRTRYTLAAIAVGRNDARGARVRIGDYMGAVKEAKSEHLAVPSLLGLASATANPKVRQLIAEALLQAERAELAHQVRTGSAAPAAATSWTRAASAAATPPGEVDLQALLPS